MRTKSGLPKRKALRTMPKYMYGFKDNPLTESYRHPHLMSDTGTYTYTSVLSLFSGCGGMDLGLLGGFRYKNNIYGSLPFKILHAYDNDERAVETYKLNVSPNISVADLTDTDLGKLPYADLLIGGFPCQDFSSSGTKLGFEGKRGNLYKIMVEYMTIHQPKLVVAENVPHLAKMKSGAILSLILSDLEEAGYDVNVWNMYCPDYGLPQNRSRLFLVCVRKDLPGNPLLSKPNFLTRHRSIDWAIEDLAEIIDETIPNQSQYFVATKATAGAGQGDEQNVKGEISYCIRANPKARIHFHYSLERRLTVRECARLQSFPDEFVFPHSSGSNVMQIGNAVPPIIAHVVASSLANYFSLLKENSLDKTEKKVPRPKQLSLLAGT